MRFRVGVLREKLEREVGETEEVFTDKDVEDFEDKYCISPSSKFFIDGYEVVKFVAREPDDLSFACYYYEIEVYEETYICFRQEDDKKRTKTIVDILGTSHNSSNSVEIVEEKLRENDYDKCFIELDETRANRIMNEDSTGLSLSKIVTIPLIVYSKGNSLATLISFVLWPLFIVASLAILFLRGFGFILKKIANLSGRNYEEGLEFKKAIKECENKETELVLIDRDINRVLSDYWKDEKKSKVKFVYFVLSLWILSNLYVVFGKNSSVDEVIDNKNSIMNTHFYENRNNYMVGEILANTNNKEKVLIIVGAKHTKGIEKLLEEYDFKEIRTESVDTLY